MNHFQKLDKSFKLVSVNNRLFERSVSSLEIFITFDERFKVTLVHFFIQDFNL